MTGGGTGIEATSYATTIRDCIVTGNSTGILDSGSSLIEHSIISNNSSVGLDCVFEYSCLIKNSLISNNNYGVEKNGTLINSTVVDNGFGLAGEIFALFDVVNSVVWNNGTAADIEEGEWFFTNSLLQDGDQYCSLPEFYCIDTTGDDPLFLDAAAENYRLSAGSPAIDAGINGAVDWSTDLDGNPRIVEVTTPTVDIGAYEYQPPAAILVEIYVRPTINPNTNPRARGVIPVVLLGNEAFDVANVDVGTLRFGPGEAATSHDLTDTFTYNDHLQDVNLDGFMDLVGHYRTRESGITSGLDEASLTGATLDGSAFMGTDAITFVGGWRGVRRGARGQEPE